MKKIYLLEGKMSSLFLTAEKERFTDRILELWQVSQQEKDL